MIDFNKLEDNLVMICPNTKKELLVKEISQKFPNKHIKFLSKQDILNNVYFKYDYDSLLFLSDNYAYSYANGIEILDNLHSIKNGLGKLELLNEIYTKLLQNNLLKTNTLFPHLFVNKKTYIYGYSEHDLELKNALDLLGVSYAYLTDESLEIYQHDVYKYNLITDEVKALFINIMELLNQGVSLNNIYLYQLPSEYESLIKKYAIYHNIKIEGLSKTYLFDSPIYKKYISYLEKYSIKEAYDILANETKYDLYDAVGALSTIIIKIIYLKQEKDEFISLLNFIARTTPLKEIKYDNSIKVCDYNTIIGDNDHVFILGFSLDSYPKISRDVDFYSDIEKQYLGKNTSTITNLIYEESLTNFINHTKNIHISYKVKKGKKEYYPSLLISKLNMNVIDGFVSDIRYSKQLSKIEVAEYHDMKKTYGIDNEYIKTYSEEELEYLSYNHKFSGLDFTNNDDLKLSATTITKYNTCPFQYFVNRVLKIGEFEYTFPLKLGNLFHKILQDSLTKDINLVDYQEDININFVTAKEQVLLENLLPQVLDVIKKNKEFTENSDFKRALAETEITIDLNENTKLTGKIDKVIFDDETKELIIVDYKSGSFKFNEKKNQYGIDLQLPIYALLLSMEFNEYKNIGMYIQNICLSKKELLSNDIIAYVLAGLTLKDTFAVKRIDNYLGSFDFNGNVINKSVFLDRIKIKKDGMLDAYSGMEEEAFDALKKIAKAQVDITLDNIRNNRFDIAPIKFNGQRNLPCKYCEYNDICYMEYQDIRYVNLSGGEEDETE